MVAGAFTNITLKGHDLRKNDQDTRDVEYYGAVRMISHDTNKNEEFTKTRNSQKIKFTVIAMPVIVFVNP